MDLSDYLLVKAFSKSKYMEDFNKGTVYLNNSLSFWNWENKFQQDHEGSVFEQRGRGFLLKTNNDFPNILAKSSSLDEVLKYVHEENCGEIIGETTDFNIRLEGYLCCFYLLPKKDVSFTQNSMSITNKKEQEDLSVFLEKYLEESETHDFHVSIYDAVIFCNVFFKGLSEKGYLIKYGQVKYQDVDELTRISQYQNGDWKSILFTKPTNYSYQKEFRILINKSDEKTKDHISEDGFDIELSRYGSFCYDDIKKG